MNSTEIAKWSETQDKLKSFVLRHTRDAATAEDIVQDVFLKVFSKVSQLKDSEKLTAWIFRIARNAIADHFREKNKTINHSDIDWEVEAQPLNDCVSTCLQLMMSTLPDKYRHALESSELKEHSQLELAQELNISYSGAKSRVQRARQMLKEKMEQAYLIKFDSYGNVIVCEDKQPCSCNKA